MEPHKTKISRRDFLKLGASAGAAGAGLYAAQHTSQMAFGTPKAGASGSASSSSSMEESILKTTCALCPSGCGLDVRVAGGKAVKVEGNPLHSLNQGVCCLKGQTSLEILYSPERIRNPRIQTGARGSGDWREVPWDEALNLVAQKLRALRDSGVAHTVAVLHGETRGQMRSLLQRFMAAYGSPNLVSQDSLGEGVIRQAMYLSQGVNGLPIYDFNNANYVVAFGGNPLESSRGVIGHLGSLAFMRRGRPQRGKLIAIHPRLGLTGVKADEWVPIRPATYGALALGMANVMINSDIYDQEFVRDYTFGFEDFEDEAGNLHQGFKKLVLERYTLDRVAAITGVATETIARLAGEFATNRPAVAVMPTEPGELSSGNGLYTALAIHALNALVGAIDAEGGVLVQRFPEVAEWPDFSADAIAEAGLTQERLDGAGGAEMQISASSYHNLAGRILSGQPYPTNVLFLYNANPVYDAPNGGQFVEALMKVPLVISFASTLDESAAHADLILPASTFLEVWGDDYLEGTGYAGVSLRRPVVEAVHNTRNPGDVFLQLAAKIGGPLAQALPWADYQSLVSYRLSAIDMDWEKFEANGCWSEMVYFNAAPGSPAWANVIGPDRLYAPQDGRYDFYSRELFALLMEGQAQTDLACLPHFELPTTLADNTQEAVEWPFLLVSQSLITQSNQWQGIVPTLQESYGLQAHAKWEGWVEINTTAAGALGIQDGDRVWVQSPAGRIQVAARLYQGIWPNAVFIPSGLGHRTLVKWGRNSDDNLVIGANPNQLREVGSEALSGQAVFSPTRVKVYKV